MNDGKKNIEKSQHSIKDKKLKPAGSKSWNPGELTFPKPGIAISPCIAQIGLHKGGLYAHKWLENLFGCKLHNADRVHPEWQNPKVGDAEPVCQSQEGKRNSGWLVAGIEQNRMLG